VKREYHRVKGLSDERKSVRENRISLASAVKIRLEDGNEEISALKDSSRSLNPSVLILKSIDMYKKTRESGRYGCIPCGWIYTLHQTFIRCSHIQKRVRVRIRAREKSSKPRTLQDTFNDLLSNIQKPLGIHHIRTILFSLPGGSDRTGLKRRKDATSHIILDNLYLGEKGSTPPLSSPKSLRSLR
jgi:hypothetical protein